MRRLTIALLFLTLIACRKDKYDFSLVGKWQLVGTFNSTLAGGYQAVTLGEKHTIQFKSNGSYVFTPPIVSSSPGCTGTYERITETKVEWEFCAGIRGKEFRFEDNFLLMETIGPGGSTWLKYERSF